MAYELLILHSGRAKDGEDWEGAMCFRMRRNLSGLIWEQWGAVVGVDTDEDSEEEGMEG